MTTIFGKVLLCSSGELYMLPDGGGLYNLHSSQPQGADRDVGVTTGEFFCHPSSYTVDVMTHTGCFSIQKTHSCKRRVS